MPAPQVCVLRAPGTNCDLETAHAFELCGARAERVHLFRLLERPAALEAYQILCIPGGFSYGDDIGAGVIFSRELRGKLGEAVGAFLRADKLVLGICNGFQVLLKAGILPDGPDAWPPQRNNQQHENRATATLTWNDVGRYTDLWVRLRVGSSNNVFLRGLEELELPVAHAEGKVVTRDDTVLDTWREHGQIALRYAAPERRDDADSVLPYPHNPNGSVANIAGLGDRTGRVLGLMPHPERFLYATQHPQWTRRGLTGEGQGLAVFRNAVAYFG